MHAFLNNRRISSRTILALAVVALTGATASSQTFDSMGFTWTSSVGAGFYESDATSFTLYGAEAADQVVSTPLTVTPGDTLSYDYFLSGVGPDNAGLGSDASVTFREGFSDAPWPDILAAPRLVFDIFGGASGGEVSAMDLQDVSNNDYAIVPSLTTNTTGLHFELYFDSETTAQLKIWNEMGDPTGDPVFDSVASGVAFDMDGTIASIRIGIWNSPEQYLTVSNLTLIEGDLPEGVSGDFNGDGTVNLADYTVWRNNLGATEDDTVLGGNGDALGTVDAADYDLWKSNLGDSMAAAGAVASVNVPEPSSWLLLSVLAISLGAYRRAL